MTRPQPAVPVLTAVTDSVREAELVAAFADDEFAVAVVRRCVDLPDLLAIAATRTARAVVMSANLRRLDRDALERLTGDHVAVVALVDPADEITERRMRQLGVHHLVPSDAEPKWIAEAVLAAIADAALLDTPQQTSASSSPRTAIRDLPAGPDPEAPDLPAGTGRLVAVWGPTGAPGRTTVAVGLAAEAADLGVLTLLVDADSYGGVVAQVLGLVDESPGLAGATRLANNGVLDVTALAELARTINPRLRVLTGIGRPDRWPELRPHALQTVWSLAGSLAVLTVVDCGFGLEQDEDLSYDTVAPQRNGATITTLLAADTIVAVATADPVGLQRFVRALSELRELVPNTDIQVVVNRVRRGVVGTNPESEIASALRRYAGVNDVLFLPLDVRGCDAAIAEGRTLVEESPASPIRPPLRVLAARLTGSPAPLLRRRRLVRR